MNAASNIDPLAPVHPGEILREEFLMPLGLTAYAVAKACHVARTRIERVANEQTPVTSDTALRLARYFGTTPEFWMAIQMRYDLEVTRRDHLQEINVIEPRKVA